MSRLASFKMPDTSPADCRSTTPDTLTSTWRSPSEAAFARSLTDCDFTGAAARYIASSAAFSGNAKISRHTAIQEPNHVERRVIGFPLFAFKVQRAIVASPRRQILTVRASAQAPSRRTSIGITHLCFARSSNTGRMPAFRRPPKAHSKIGDLYERHTKNPTEL